MSYPFKPTKKRVFHKKLYGFDIETYGDKNTFLLGSIVGEDGDHKFYTEREKMIEDIFTLNKYRDSWLVATNSQFDFNCLFGGTEQYKTFKFMFRGSDFISAETWIGTGGSSFKQEKGHDYKICFVDTLNYIKSGVASLGKFIGLNKLDPSIKLGTIPKNEEEWEKFREYNKRDSEISLKAMRQLLDAFIELGANPKKTIASTAKSLFQNSFLDDIYFSHDKDVLLRQFQAYYGGRTEAFCRGKIEDCYYWDVNSLYPSVMLNSFPDPNSLRQCIKGTIEHIMKYEGISYVSLNKPRIGIPLLPYRYKGKLIFPYGNFSGAYSHVELRKALEEGYSIESIGWQHYYKRSCEPFKGYMMFLYAERKKHPKGSIMNEVCKILMNSLYGKFAQKFLKRDNFIHKDNLDMDVIRNCSIEEIKGTEFYCVKKDQKPSVFCFPIWSLYVTAYGRIKLFDYMKKCSPIYVDTDSIITKDDAFANSEIIGEMKMEKFIKNGIIIKPKMYITDGDIRLKGAGNRRLLTEEKFMSIIENGLYTYNKFSKTKESLRRHMDFNTSMLIKKHFSLEDDKRVWEKEFDHTRFDISDPITLMDGLDTRDIEIMNRKILQYMEDEKISELKKTGFFNSKGADITDKEYMENEITDGY